MHSPKLHNTYCNFQRKFARLIAAKLRCKNCGDKGPYNYCTRALHLQQPCKLSVKRTPRTELNTHNFCQRDIILFHAYNWYEIQELIRRRDSERELFLQHRTCRGQRLRPLNELVISSKHLRYLPTHQTDC